MTPEEFFGSDHQPRNHLSENNSSSRQNPSSQNGQYIFWNTNNGVLSNPTNSGTSLDERSSITGVNSSMYGGPLSQRPGFNRAQSAASITGPQTFFPPTTTCKNRRLVMMQEEARIPNNTSAWQGVHCQQQQRPRQQLVCTAVQPQQAGQAVKRLTSYLHFQRHRPPNNDMRYWRSFVRHYYSPQVKRRTCFSRYAHLENRIAEVEPWTCPICGCTPANGFAEKFDVLPRLHHLYFNSSGVVDECMFLDSPTEITSPGGSIMLYYDKAVKESIYKSCRVVHEGKLRVVFTSQLQIISWDFCVQHHEVLLSRRLISSQVNDLIKDATSSKPDDDANGNRVSDAARKLEAMVNPPEVSDSGFPKHFVLNLQVSEVVNSMKDLMDFSINTNTSPIETLKRFGKNPANGELETTASAQNVQLTGKTVSHNRKPPLAVPGMYHQNPPSARIIPKVEQFMLNDLLNHMQQEATQQTQSVHSRPHKKSRLQTGRTKLLDGKSENGKGLNSSSSSNVVKKDTDLDDDDDSMSAKGGRIMSSLLSELHL
ncbi:hypothetical protein RND81_06G238200 [Saponaria officinalis]|uniref:Uncharacterized protein n=1 Tax=Saponaria officinalis TaxID=3572 RepID=A0AAW1KDM4_SAPOF